MAMVMDKKLKWFDALKQLIETHTVLEIEIKEKDIS